MERDPALVRGDLETHLDETRRSRLVFCVGTVLATPGFLVLAVWLFLVAASHITRNWWFTYHTFAHGLCAAVVAAVLVQLFRPKPGGRTPTEWRSLTLGAACTFVLLALAFGTGRFVDVHPGAFWTLFAAVAFAALGFMGRAYAPRESYYMGWWTTNYSPDGFNNPFTFRDNLDRTDYWTGWIVAVPSLVFDAYADVFGSGWALRTLTDDERQVAWDLVVALAKGDADAARHAAHRSGRAARVLQESELVRASKQGPQLSDDGLRLIGRKL